MHLHTIAGTLAASAMLIGGGTITPGTAGSSDVVVNWIETSDDTLGDVIARALEESPRDAVAADLELLSSVAGSTHESLAGLDDLSEEQLDSAVDAVTSGEELPEYLDLVGPAEGSSETPGRFTVVKSTERAAGTLPSVRGAINDRFSYETTDYVRRGITDSKGALKWTDRLDLRTVTDPSANSTKFTHHLKYFPSTNWFNAGKGFVMSLYQEVRLGQTPVHIGGVTLEDVKIGATSKIVTHTKSMRGMAYDAEIALYAMHKDKGQTTPGYYSSAQKTGVARCEEKTNVCKY